MFRPAAPACLWLFAVLAIVPTPSVAAPPAGPAQETVSNVGGGMSSGNPTPEERLSGALQQIGMTTCAATVERAARFLFDGAEANFTVQPLGPDANRWPTVITLESAHASQGRVRLSTLVVSPGPTCSGLYQQVVSWPTPCAELKASVFATYQNAHIVFRAVQMSEVGPGLQLYLMPAGTGCVSGRVPRRGVARW